MLTESRNVADDAVFIDVISLAVHSGILFSLHHASSSPAITFIELMVMIASLNIAPLIISGYA
jgi:hypothetical protein